jgi:2',3'-cyclic-nucleotide 2'-phosphodiesterase (5'-nucleotidase family)
VRGLKARTLKTKDGLRVGIIGVVTPETPQYTHPRNVKGLVFTSPEEAVQQNIRALKGRADLILVLSHLGYARDRQLAARVKGIDVIVGGHSHTKLTRPEVVAGVLIVQAYEHGKTLGVLDLTWRDGKIAAYAGQLLEIRPTPGQEDPGIGVLVARYQERLDRVLGEQVGRTEVDLNGEQEQVRTTETNLGNLVTDVLRARAGADVALINGGSIKKSIIRGKILRQDVYAALPFNNYLVAFRLTGRELREALEHGVSGVEEQLGRFPQVSGLAFTYKPSAPPGLRVQEVLVGGRPLQPEREYTVATLDFMAAGGDGYRVFGKVMGGVRGIAAVEAMMSSPQVVYIDPGRWVREDVIDYLKAHPAIAPRVEGRIREVN